MILLALALAVSPIPPLVIPCVKLVATFQTATPSQTIALTGACPPTVIKGVAFTPAVRLDLTGATFPDGGLRFINVTGVSITGGTFGPTLPGSRSFGLGGNGVHQISVTGAHFVDLDFAVSFDSSDHVVIARNRIDGTRVDSIRFFNGHFAEIAHNAILGAARFDALAHPDAVQLSSDTAITSDVSIHDNFIEGDGQGIGAYLGHQLMGGYDRISVTDNIIALSFSQGLAMYNCRACTAERNTILTLPLSAHFTSFNMVGSLGLSAAANTMIDDRVGAKP